MRVFEAIAEVFVAEGTEVAFALMGYATMNWFVAMDGRGVRMVSVRHEGGAVAMADGYSRATGKVGVASTTAGPGLTQIGTQLMVASRARIPLVVFVGDTPTFDRRHYQEMDQRRFVEACEAGFQAVSSAATATEDAGAAFRRARLERRPIVLSAPKNILSEVYPWEFKYLSTLGPTSPLQRTCPDPSVVERAADLIAAARRPVILAGQGAVRSGARDSILMLATQCGALVATTLLAKGWLDDDPFCVGISGAFSSAIAEELFADADLVVAVGASLNHFTTEGGLLFPNARYLAINIEPFFRDGLGATDSFLCGDADAVTRALIHALAARGHSNVGFRANEVRGRFTPWSGKSAAPDGKVDPREAVRSIDRYLDDQTLVVLGIGHYWAFPIMHMRGPRGGNGFIFTHQFGAIGQCLSSAIGVAVGRPDMKVVAFDGDASLMMHIQELDTAARNGVKLMVVVLNDSALGAELHHLTAEGISNTNGALIPTPDFAELAATLGWDGAVATNLDQVEAAMEAYLGPGEKPYILDVRVPTSVIAEPTQKLTYGIVNSAPHQGMTTGSASVAPAG